MTELLAYLRCMARIVLLIAVITVSMAVVNPQIASAHDSTYCGHGDAYDGGVAQWVYYQSGSGSGVYHQHRYDHHIRTSIWGYTYDHYRIKVCAQ